MAVLEEIGTAIGAVATQVGPAVAGLRTARHHGGGSGVVIAPGTVLTVAHALHGDEAEVQFAGGRRTTARVAGIDGDLGIAVLSADTGDAPPVAFADAAPPLGAAVVALSDPGGRGLRATLGFVTTTEAGFRTPRGRRVAGAIEHSAPLPRGSSGGPLVDLDGRLVGLNAARRDGGLILALAADGQLRERVDRLARGEQVEPRRLGVAVAPPRLARRLRRAVGLPERDGLLVRAVQEGSPAERAGVQVGDLLVRAGDRELDGLDALHAAIDTGDALTLGVVRGTEEREVHVRLAAAEARA